MDIFIDEYSLLNNTFIDECFYSLNGMTKILL